MFVNIKMVINILMNDFYYRLNILENPVKDRDAVINMYKSAKGSYSVESASILKDEVIDLFSDIGLTVDHIIPRSKNGPSKLSNYQCSVSYTHLTLPTNREV